MLSSDAYRKRGASSAHVWPGSWLLWHSHLPVSGPESNRLHRCIGPASMKTAADDFVLLVCRVSLIRMEIMTLAWSAFQQAWALFPAVSCR
jgi:hypothetical protein